MTAAPHVPDTAFCVNHPDRETRLRCKSCGKPICPDCAVHTPTGYSCKECLRGRQRIFETARWHDYLLAAVVAAGLSYLGSLFVSRIGFFTILLAPIAGTLIAEAVRLLVGRRRSKLLFQLTAVAVAVGALPSLLAPLLGMLGGGGLGYLFALLWPGLYAFVITSTVYYRLSGIQLNL